MSKRSGMNRRSFVGKVGAAGATASALAHSVAPLAHGQAARNINVVMSQEPPTLGYGLGNAYVNTIVKRALGSEPELTKRNDINDWVPFVALETPSLTNGLAMLVGEGGDQHLQTVYDLRNDVRWADGTPLTAHDYVFGWELYMHPDYAVPTRSFAAKISSVVAEGDHRLIVRFLSENEARFAAAAGRTLGGTHLVHYQQPPALYASFAGQVGPVLDPNYYKDAVLAAPRHILGPIIDATGVASIAQHPISRAPIGVGPFRVQEWVAGQFMATAAVPSFFLGAPRSPGITFRFVPDTNAIIAQLATGEADVVTEDALTEFNAPDLLRLERDRAIRAHFVAGATWEHVDINLDNPMLSDIKVRQAIAHGVNRQGIVDSVFNGRSAVIHSYAPSWRWDYNSDVVRYDYNPQKARQLLEEAGYRRGPDGIYAKGNQKLSFKYQTTAGNQPRLLVSQVVQANLKEVGIDIQLDYVNSTEFFAAGDNPGPLWGRRFELGQYAWVGSDDPAPVASLYSTSGIPTAANGRVGQNFPGISNPRIDELVARADASIDQAERTTLYAEVQKIWAEILGVLPLYARSNVTAIKRSLQNFRPTPTNTPPTWNSWDWYLAD
jgi:peptide/nickel transport system substrate-binding protein